MVCCHNTKVEKHTNHGKIFSQNFFNLPPSSFFINNNYENKAILKIDDFYIHH